MDEKTLQELLIKLGIPTNRSYTDLYELLDAKLSEYLDRQDDASQALVEDIQDALEFVEKKKEEAGGGIALAKVKQSNTDTVNLDGLRRSSQKHVDAANAVASENASGGAGTTGTTQAGISTGAMNSGKLWFYSLTGAQNIDNMFFQACDDLKYDQFDHAESIFEMIIQAEPNNASAYLGKTLATFKFKEPKEIGSALDLPVDTDINLRRAKDHGTVVQKKYIEDALQERENAIDYRMAEKLAAHKDKIGEQQRAFGIFQKLGSYRDAVQRAETCDQRAKELAYKDAVRRENDAKTSNDYRNAKNLFASLVGYRDADKHYEVCRQKEEELAEKERLEKENAERFKKVHDPYHRLYQEFCDIIFAEKQEFKRKSMSQEPKKKLDELKKYIDSTPELDEFFDRAKLKKEADEKMASLIAENRKYRVKRLLLPIENLFWWIEDNWISIVIFVLVGGHIFLLIVSEDWRIFWGF